MAFDKNILTRIIMSITDSGEETEKITHIGDDKFEIHVKTDPGQPDWHSHFYTAVFFLNEEGKVVRQMNQFFMS